MKITSNIFFLFLFLIACSPTSEEKENTDILIATPVTTQNFDIAKEALATSVGTQAYLFGASIMTQYYFRNRMKKMIAMSKNNEVLKFGASADDGLHFNEMIHTRNLVTHEIKVGGTANIDTRYSVLFFNLENGPQVLHVPSIKDRYFSINITDAYLGNHPYICSRLGDTEGGKYAFVGPDWEGELPKGVTVRKMPQNNFLVIVRILVKDRKTDNENVTAIQDQFKLESLKKYNGEIAEDEKIEVPSMPKPEGLSYYKIMGELMKANPPAGNQDFIWSMLGQVGMTKEVPFDYENLDPALKKGLAQGLKNGKAIINWRAKERGTKTTSNWHYNLGLGEDHDNYMFRSEWAVQGLTVNSAEEAIFFNVFKDGKGQTLDGSHQYVINLSKEQAPPVNAFWSITSYDENFDLVKNNAYHYGVGDRTDALKYNEDGSLTIYVQNEPPKAGIGNWIPTPKEGEFKLTFRFYNPKPVLFDTEKAEAFLPPVERVDLKD